jgi:hypothetical protein
MTAASTKKNVAAVATRLANGSPDAPWTDDDRAAVVRALLDACDGDEALEAAVRTASVTWSGPAALRAYAATL